MERRRLSPERVEQIREGRIRRLAYRRWEQAGRPPGDGVDFWCMAEREYDESQGRFYRVVESLFPVKTGDSFARISG